MSEESIRCLYCQRSADEAPLLKFRYREIDAWICAQHLPLLIHKPAQLADKLPGLEDLPSVEHEH